MPATMAATLTEIRNQETLEARERAETKARERAARGAVLFDRLFPEWPWQVKLTTLKMAQGGSGNTDGYCVLSQISGQRGRRLRSYRQGKLLLNARLKREFTSRMETYYGLNVSPNVEDDVQFRELTAAWKDEIRARRASA